MLRLDKCITRDILTGVTPHKSEGIEPFTMVNSPPCQVGVTPHNPGGIEPSALVNSLPGQVGATPSHPINTPLGIHEVTSSVSSCQNSSPGLSGFVRVRTSASACALRLPTNSVRVFRGRSSLRGWMNSDTSLRSGNR